MLLLWDDTDKVDVIVNTTQSTLNLNTGAVSKSILLAGGMRLQQEINSQKMSGITTNEGDVIVTSGGNMQCTNIYHVLCCSWDPRGTNASQVLRKIMQTCLNTASQNGYSSIAFPAIGTGGLQFPRDATARIMYEEVTSYSSNNPASSISNILFVVYDQDFPTIQAFEDEIGRLTGVPLKKRHGHGSGGSAAASRTGANSSAYGGFTPVKPKKKKGKVSPGQTFQGASGYAASASRGEAEDTLYMQFKEKPGGSGDCQMMVGNVLVQLQKGDITNEMTDAIVNSSNVNLDLRQGAVSQAILKKGGGSIVAECQRLGRQQEDSVVMTNAGNMKCTKIIHMITPYRKLEDSIIEMLLFAEKQRLSSIAMPAVGTGALAIPPKTVAHIILDAIGDFVQQNNPKFLKVIRITIFQPPLVAVFNKEMKSMIGTPMKDTRSVIGKAWGSFKSWVGASDNPPKKDFARMADTIILYIYAESKNDIDAAITKIENLMATEFIDTTISKDTVMKLTDEDMSKIYQVAEPLKIVFRQYVILKQTMDAKNKQGTNNERILYHGTSSDSVGKINTGGFNRSFAGKNATYYGAGSYFAVESSYSASKTYSPVDPNTGHKHVYHCKVLTGEFTTGSQGLLVPPSKNPNDPTDCYDSVTDNVQSPTLFVVFNDAMAYPEYHITFT
uniref:Poly [ADP-ribose] polymerase n=1 Tax=Saccoglossus kowalevskii TaxID=10224 RepID=A0ABM0GYA3_SACKO|nr:PREDICTED: poly [ADP-ribose] polymerase 15-like [Saccoglossus kowalevskii]